MKLKKKILCAFVAVGMLATVLTGCGKKDSNTFTVGFDAEYPPYGYMDDNGEYTGFDLELAEEVCKLKGWTLKKQPIAWDSKDNELNSGSIDCIWNGFTINGREDDYEWWYLTLITARLLLLERIRNLAADLSGKQ